MAMFDCASSSHFWLRSQLTGVLALISDATTLVIHAEQLARLSQVSGLHTNLDFLRRAVAHPAFAAGELDTQFISKHRQQLFATEQLTPEFWALAAALLHQVHRG